MHIIRSPVVRPNPGKELTQEPALAFLEPRRLLSWLYLGRSILVGAMWVGPAGAVSSLGGLLVLAVFLITGTSFWYSRRGSRSVPEPFLYGQLALDAVILTAVVHLTGGADSPFAPLYVLLIVLAALLLSTRGAILIGLFAIAGYLASHLWTSAGVMESAVLYHGALFVTVAPVIGYLGGRLRAAGTALGELQSELKQLRLDTGDILDTMSTGVLTVDGAGALAYINPAGEELLQIASERWIGEPVLAHLDAIAPGLGGVIERSARDGIPIRRYETESLAEDAFVLGVSTTVLERPAERGIMVTAIFQDITVRKRVEGLRRRAERLEAVAALSASLAHEIKNPLASIRSAVEQLAEGGVEPSDGQVLRGLVVRESDRLSRLLSEFLDFARVRIAASEPVEMESLLEGVVDLVRAHPDSSGRSLTVHVENGIREIWALGAEDLLHRAVFNLVLNAVQWSGDGGEVRLSLDELTSDLISPESGASRLIRLTVADSGPGVPQSIRDEIFDPFFTRRAGGTGLGLALVQRAVEAHSGAIFVDDAGVDGGPGATFTLYLPAADAILPDATRQSSVMEAVHS